jgi:hypothetical protein
VIKSHVLYRLSYGLSQGNRTARSGKRVRVSTGLAFDGQAGRRCNVRRRWGGIFSVQGGALE